MNNALRSKEAVLLPCALPKVIQFILKLIFPYGGISTRNHRQNSLVFLQVLHNISHKGSTIEMDNQAFEDVSDFRNATIANSNTDIFQMIFSLNQASRKRRSQQGREQ